jgi:hypothetical protein
MKLFAGVPPAKTLAGGFVGSVQQNSRYRRSEPG